MSELVTGKSNLEAREFKTGITDPKNHQTKLHSNFYQFNTPVDTGKCTLSVTKFETFYELIGATGEFSS